LHCNPKQRPDLNELDVPEWAELALDKADGGSYGSASNEPQAERND
jgi:hypothetical protein